jgi:hypothetical protein
MAGIAALPAALPRDSWSACRAARDGHTEMEAALASASSAARPTSMRPAERRDASTAEIANAEKLQKLKGAGARGTPESEKRHRSGQSGQKLHGEVSRPAGGDACRAEGQA